MRRLSLLLCLAVPLAAQAPSHPLDGLSGREHWTIYDALRTAGRTDSTTRFLYVGLREPPKADVLAWRPGQPFRREATVHLYAKGRGYEATVDLRAKRVIAWSESPGSQFMGNREENAIVRRVTLADARVRDALRARGFTDLAQVNCDPANHGYFDLPEERGKRVVHATCTSGEGRTLGYGEPIDGLVVVVDVSNERIVRIVDTGARPRTGAIGHYDADAVGPTRTPPNPVRMVQPGGPSYTLAGSQVRWQNWSFQFRTDARRGLVVSQVRYADGGRERSIMYQGSLSELFVPYMDPADPWNYQGYFDLGTYPSLFGGIASSLERGVECPDYATYFDSWVVNADGAPRLRARTSCLFERGTSDVAWRHGREGGTVVDARPKTDLVLRMYMTAGNYDYLFDWVFQQDGTVRVDAAASGMDQVKAAANAADDERYGRLIAPGLVGVNHSHFFSFRIDLDVDGAGNSLQVERLRTERLPAQNPRRSIWSTESVTARTEAEGMRMSTMAAPELWRIVNPSVRGPYSGFAGYQIESHSAMSLLSPDDYMQKRGAFTEHMLWITPYQPAELYAAGDYPTASVAPDGLARWTAANRPIANTDIVAWVTMGFHHVPRPEDWPVMPTARHSFEIRPMGFFARNPAIDLPPP